jgi:hypothetical protein
MASPKLRGQGSGCPGRTLALCTIDRGLTASWFYRGNVPIESFQEYPSNREPIHLFPFPPSLKANGDEYMNAIDSAKVEVNQWRSKGG